MLRRIAFTSLLLFPVLALGAPKVETQGPCSDTAVPDTIKKSLSPQGYHVTLDDGSAVDLWPRAEIAGGSKGREDATYPLALSAFAGVIRFEKNTRDYRGDAIPAGTYNLRYELQPSDGDHLGTSPTPDFLMLVPASADTNADQTYTFDQLIALSRQVTGKKHPAPLNLVPAEAKEFPSVATDSEGRTILNFKIKTGTGDLPVALVVKGTTTE